MQTFLPYAEFDDSAKCLDTKRLGKQRVEAYQILKVLLGIGKRNKNGKLAWENHPAVNMWKGYEIALYKYAESICKEWISRGYKDTVLQKLSDLYQTYLLKYDKEMLYPKWLGNEKLHASHRSNLLRKNKEYYSKFNWKEPDNLEYVWPISNVDLEKEIKIHT